MHELIICFFSQREKASCLIHSRFNFVSAELRAMTMMKTKMTIIRAIKMYQMQFERLFEVKSTQMMSNHGKGRRLDPPTALPPKKIRLRPFPTTNRVEKKSRLYYIQYHNLITGRANSDSNMNIRRIKLQISAHKDLPFANQLSEKSVLNIKSAFYYPQSWEYKEHIDSLTHLHH